jgi:UDP-2,4-diacetamido-2,4,6-trideoxy-beta-L-altropyranose hydrolase
MTEVLLFRVDAGPSIGLGHFVRCVALAQAWREGGGRAVFAMGDTPQPISQRLEARGIGLVAAVGRAGGAEDRRATIAEAARHGARTVVLDGYTFGANFQADIVNAKLGCVVIDDNAEAERYAADVVVNGNVFATEALYEGRAPRSRLLVGPRYALLRSDFALHGTKGAARAPATRVLVTFGGSDPTGLTLRALEALRRVDAEITVLVGATFRDKDAIARSASERTCVVHDAQNVPELMAWADVALTAAGSTCLEAAFMGLACVAVVVAENQRAVAKRLSELGLVRALDDAIASPVRLAEELRAVMNDDATRAAVAARGPELVDGHGATRTAAVIKELCV